MEISRRGNFFGIIDAWFGVCTLTPPRLREHRLEKWNISWRGLLCGTIFCVVVVVVVVVVVAVALVFKVNRSFYPKPNDISSTPSLRPDRSS